MTWALSIPLACFGLIVQKQHVVECPKTKTKKDHHPVRLVGSWLILAGCTVHQNQLQPISRSTSRSAELIAARNLNSTATIQNLAPTAQLSIHSWRQSVADPAGSMGRPRTTHKFGSKFYYYFSETGPRSLSSQSRPKTP